MAREYRESRRVLRGRRGTYLPPFGTWLRERVQQMVADGDRPSLSLITMSRPPFPTIKHYTSMWAHGYHFRADDEDGRANVSYDSGVAALITQECVSSRADRHPVEAALNYVGVIRDILLVDYGIHQYNVLKCSWIRPNLEGPRTIRRDVNGFWSVKHGARQTPVVEPYVFPNHVQQVSFRAL